MVNCMTRCKNGPDGCVLYLENLSVFNWELATVWLVFINSKCELRVICNQIRNAASVITMPVSQENV